MFRRLSILLLCATAFAQSKAPPVVLSGANQCASIGVSGQSTVGIQVTGTFSATLTPEVAIQGQAPQATTVTPSTSSTPQSTITGTGAFRAGVGGYDSFLVCVTAYTSGSATVYLNATSVSAGAGASGGGSGSGTVSPNSGVANAVGVYASAGGSTTIGAAANLTYSAPTLTVSAAGAGNGALALSGNTSGAATITAPATAGTNTNLFTLSNGIQLPAAGSTSTPIISFGANLAGFWNLGNASTIYEASSTDLVLMSSVGLRLSNTIGYQFSSTSGATGSADTGMGRSSAGVVSADTTSSGNGLGTFIASAYQTKTNCAVNSVSPAACGAAAAGAVVIPTTTTTYTINTTAVTANSRILLSPQTWASNLPSTPTCVAPASGFIGVSASTAATSFTITLPSTTGTVCLSYLIVN